MQIWDLKKCAQSNSAPILGLVWFSISCRFICNSLSVRFLFLFLLLFCFFFCFSFSKCCSRKCDSFSRFVAHGELVAGLKRSEINAMTVATLGRPNKVDSSEKRVPVTSKGSCWGEWSNHRSLLFPHLQNSIKRTLATTIKY